MPKQCKPTIEAIQTRIRAFQRHLAMKDAYNDTIPIEIFGIKHKIKKEGLFTIEDLLEELK